MNQLIRNLLRKNISDSDVIREYYNCEDVKLVAQLFGISTKEVNAILKKGKVKKKKKSNTDETELQKIGMSERDFWN